MEVITNAYDLAILSPAPWLETALSLKEAASQLDWTKVRKTERFEHQEPIYKFLIGLALENLLKGILIAHGAVKMAKGENLNEKIKTHNLKNLAGKIDASKFEFSADDIKVLEDLEAFVTWIGRYPIPIKEKDTSFIVGWSTYEYEAELSLFERLRSNLVEFGWSFDWDGNKQPLSNSIQDDSSK